MNATRRPRAPVVIGAAIAAVAAAAVLYHLGASTTHQVTLSATGGAAMDVAYTVGDKNSQNTAAPSPWSVGYRVTGGLPTVSMVVQNGGGGTTVTCAITEDGHVVNSNTAHGTYAVVQCSA